MLGLKLRGSAAGEDLLAGGSIAKDVVIRLRKPAIEAAGGTAFPLIILLQIV
jgi:hypothetical protein